MNHNLLKILFKTIIIVIVLALSACKPFDAGSSQDNTQQVNTSDVSDDVPNNQNNKYSIIGTTVNFIFMAFIVYYFLVLKPKVQDEDKQKKFIEGVSKNDEVITSGGIIGRVVQKKSDVITIEVSPKINIRVLSSEIRPYVNLSDSKSSDKSV